MRNRRFVLASLFVACAAGVAPAADADPQSAAGALIPRAVLFGNPDKIAPQLSPDGARLAFIAPVNGVLNVWVGPASDPASAKPVTSDTQRGIRSYNWAYTSNHIIYTQDKGGDENWRVYATDVATGQTRDLTPFDGVRATIEEVSPKFPSEILVGMNNRDKRFTDIHRVNLLTGERQLVIENNEYVGFGTDDNFNVRIAAKILPDASNEIFKRTADGKFEPFAKIGPEDAMTTGPGGFDKTGNILYMNDSRGRNTAALTAVDLATGKQTVLAEHPKADVAGVLVHPTEKTIQAVAFELERETWNILDPAVKTDLDYLATVTRGDLNVVSRTLDDSRWIVAFTADDGPTRYYLHERGKQNARFLFSNRAALENQKLARMRPVTIKSRDGLDLVSYLSLPVDSGAGDDAKPAKPLPMVLLVHGGPWGRDSWGLNPQHQWLANRGYAVLSVNFRGSTGFGKQFINAANGEWAGKMHNDLIDAVQWAVREKIADAQRVAIMGGSYGGYATLVGLTFTPDVFACGVSIVGPSSLVTLLQNVPPYWIPILPMMTTRVGDVNTDAGRALLNARSPLNFVDRITKPLLIGQGANDPRVKQAESDQIVRAMQSKNIPVAYVLYPDEGHGFARPQNRMSFYAVAEAFLKQHLGGRCEPIGDDFAGSTITAPAGANFVPGLSESLPKQQ